MALVIWTKQALDDLDSIAEYIAKDSSKYAKLTVGTLFNRAKVLKRFPQSGRIVPEKNLPEIKELIEGSYRIIYEQASNDRIYILTVIHSARILKL